ncbi:MAG: efflux RND transporter permease subunit [Gemmatimonadota bacterium]
MNISGPFIRRPVMTTLVMIGILVFGLLAYRRLPVSDLPTVDYPTISVSASLPGASPETMASSVATPLEKQFSTIAGIDLMTSTSSQGTTQITLQFNLDRDIDAAAQDVQAAIAQTLRQLPQGIIPPSYQKVDPSQQAIVLFAFSSSTLPLSEVDEYAQTTIAQRLSTIEGVAQVVVYGSQKYAVRVQLDPQALASRKIGINEVAEAINSGNVNLPTGTLWGASRTATLRVNGQLENAEAFRRLVVAYRRGAPVRLQDLGNVIDAVQDNRAAAWFRDTRAIVIGVQRQPGTNTVAVADRVQAEMERLKPQLPAALDVTLLLDRSHAIRESVADVKFTLWITLCLVVMVIFLFLRNLPATVIPSLALPMSLVGTFAVMYLLEYSLNNLSLMALTLAVGFVVDDAIVMLENIVRHMEMGKKPLQAALDGSREIGFTIISMTISLVAVFIPILFLGGLMGRLFQEFAATIGVAILVSGFVSLTLTPMLCGRFLRTAGHGAEHGRMYQAIERAWEASIGAYQRSLAWVMRHRRLMLGFSIAILVGTVWLGMIVPKGFIPSEDQGSLFGTTEAAEGTSFEAMVRYQQQAAAILRADPDIAAFMSALGSGGRSTTINQGRFVIRLKPRSERTRTADEIARDLNAKISQIPGLRGYITNPPVINIGGRSSKSLYQFTLQSGDIATLYQAAAELESRLRTLPELTDIATDAQIANPELRVEVDRDRAAALGLTMAQIESALYNAYGSRQVSTIYTPSNQYWVILELEPRYQRDLAALNLLYVTNARGETVPLTAVATLSERAGPLSVNHSGQLPSVTLSFNLAPGVSLGDAVALVQRTADQTLPSSIATQFSGTAAQFQSAQQGLLVLLCIAIFVIYLVLGILYESFIHPLTILSGLPFAGFGALLTLLVFGMDLSIYAFVGIILLVGLVKKNAIMMIDFAIEAERKEGKNAEAAILEACLVRFRPIMMTTMAALMGTLPIALGAGAGAESRRPLGVAVVGGLAFSQFVTLYLTPVIYTYFDKLRRRKGGSTATTEAPAPRVAAPEPRAAASVPGVAARGALAEGTSA